ncbi:DUF4982 domain-containing protein [bacterium]|nr:DUF4982 domain-containing protein [bacterium]
MKALRKIILFLFAYGFVCASCFTAQSGVEPFNQDWRFSKGELSVGAASVGFDDSSWEEVSLPHDWAIRGPFNPSENGYAGKLPWRGAGWYRKTFRLPNDGEGKRVYFDFGGVMAFPKVYINGKLAGQWDYGYMSFRIDATPYVKFGEDNVIAVMADMRKHGTRWYPGAGMYRQVSMTICDPIHVAHWGMFVTTPEVLDKSAIVNIQSTIENHTGQNVNADIEFQVFSPQGTLVASSVKSGGIVAGASAVFESPMTVKDPQRWDIESPNLYQARTVVRVDGKTRDVNTDQFGIRTFQFTANNGFYLNGRRVQMNGVNLHHDQGPLGAAFYPRAMERQLQIMQDMGCNALRTSHNPPAPEVVEICDRLGILVWDEAFDKWDGTADRVDGQPPLREHGERQIRNLVMRDRNSPSVMTWSIGNEIGNQPWNREGKSAERVQFMSDFARKYDPTRPITMGCFIPSTVDEPILDALDMTGWNYARRYAKYRQKYPDKPILYSESASALSTRGFYDLPLPTSKTEYSMEEHQVNSYDHSAARWSDIPDVEFQLMEDDPFVAGEFVWTGFDYLGEPTPFTQEARSSYFGIVDLCGIPKDRFYLYRSYWRPDETTVHILPHWNWPERVGEVVPVYVYTNGDSAELFLNGKSLGVRAKQTQISKPHNLAANKPVMTGASEGEGQETYQAGNDDDRNSMWSGNGRDENVWWQVDLGEVQPFKFIDIILDQEARNYQYVIKGSKDGSRWTTIATKGDWSGDAQRMTHDVDATARYVRIQFTQLQRRTRPAFWEFAIYKEPVENPYFNIMDKYRLRWLDVKYQPGELRAVAYKNGEVIGESVMRTAKQPASIRLTPDRAALSASGDDLSYILVEALDEDGTLCPLADNRVEFSIEGPASIAAVGNGNPLSLEPFQAEYRKLFYGKAMLIVKTQAGQTGEVLVTASSKGLKDGKARLVSE